MNRGFGTAQTFSATAMALGHGLQDAQKTTAASVLYVTAFVCKVPVSTTHTITSAILGVGATCRLPLVRWGVGLNLVPAWVCTRPGARLVAALSHRLIHRVVRT